MRFGPSISASLLYGLSWIMLGLTALLVALAILTSIGFLTRPISVRTDLIAAAVRAVLGLLARILVRRFERAIHMG